MHRYRPTGVTLIAVLFFIYGILGLLSALATMGLPLPDPLGRFSLIIGLGALLVAVAYLALGYGLWDLREWGRIGTLILSALALVLNVVFGVAMLFGVEMGGFRLSFPGVGAGALVQAAIAGLVVYYLARSDVRDAFASEQAPAWPAPSLGTPTIAATTNVLTPAPVAPLPMPASSPRPTELVAPPLPVLAWLAPRAPGRATRQYPIQSSRAIIGRDDSRCDVCLDDATVSTEHAAIVFENNRFIVQDLASRNGTYVNGQRIQRQMLYDGDEVRLGNTTLVFKRV